MKKELLYLFLMVSISCNIKSKIQQISFTFSSPRVVKDGKGIKDEIKFYITYFENYTVYELPVRETSSIDNFLIYDTINYEYFIIVNKINKGYLLKNLKDQKRFPIDVDSLLKERCFNGGKGDYDIFQNLVLNKKKEIEKTIDTKLVKYSFSKSIIDSAYLYFDKNLLEIPFSLSKSLNLEYSSKLVKIKYFLKHENVGKNEDVENDFFVTYLEIKKAHRSNEKEIINLIKRFNQL